MHLDIGDDTWRSAWTLRLIYDFGLNNREHDSAAKEHPLVGFHANSGHEQAEESTPPTMEKTHALSVLGVPE